MNNFYQFNSPDGIALNQQQGNMMMTQQQQQQQPCDLMPPPMKRPSQRNDFPATTMPKASLPARIVSRSERQTSIGSFGSLPDFGLTDDGVFPADDTPLSLKDNSSSCSKKSGTEETLVLEPNQIFDAPTHGHSNCSSHNNNNRAVSNGSLDGGAHSSSHDHQEEDRRTLLHRACMKYPRKKAVIQAVLQKDPSAVLRRAFVPGCCHKSKTDTNSNSKGHLPKDCYQLPINIALSHKASLEVLDLLVKTDPSQLTAKDGIHGANALCLALEKRPNDVAVLGMFLVTNPDLVRQPCDNYQNTPLHVACQRGSSVPIVRQLFKLHPASLLQRNESGKTPMDILQQQAQYSKTAKASLDYLQQKLQGQTGGN
ncbi:expressed unknown protein [Seminavis robusta]|uniref:Uncharacterized protein n=1 Tax=Seminavis robusta TaxID=568900 RepID=A0A9N8DU22_9STRA|nr:expressed unknown protein [Seminavis robusta]|eukprot:Sro356_g125390.1 n/a (369) ;mRNA; r:47623-48729